MKIFICVLLAILIVGCSSSDDPKTAIIVSDEDNKVEARSLDYYLKSPDETDIQLKRCEEIPPQARSEIFQGNCDYAEAALRLR